MYEKSIGTKMNDLDRICIDFSIEV